MGGFEENILIGALEATFEVSSYQLIFTS